MATRSDDVTNGRYSMGGKSDVIGNRIGWWERRIFPTSPLDATISLPRKYAGRPDLLAYDLYGRASLQWFVLQYNNISDVNEEFVEGAILILPSSGRLFGELLGKSSK